MKKIKAKLISQFNKKRIPLHKLIPLKTPLVVYVEPSGYCNLRCKFCPHGSGKTFNKALMPTRTFKKLMSDISKFENKVKLLRICGNGDSLMNKDIVNMVKYAREQKVVERIELITNGVLLNDYLNNNLPLYLDRIIISIEGLCADDYRNICGTNVDFQKLLDNIRVLYTNKNKCKIHIKINSEAVHSDINKKRFFDMFNDRCDEIYIENLVPMWPQFNTAYSTNKYRYEGKVVKHQVCVQIFKSLQVQADGDVVPCCVDWNRVNLLGNINTNSLPDIWNGKKIRSLQIKHLTGKKGILETCKDCTMNDYCDTDNIDLYKKECLTRLYKKYIYINNRLIT